MFATCNAERRRQDFPTAQSVRALLTAYGFAPIVRLGIVEYWVRGTKLVKFLWEGELPGESRPKAMEGAVIVNDEDRYVLSLD